MEDAREMLPKNPKKPSKKLTEDDAITIWIAIGSGQFSNRVAADLDCNPARIYDVLHGRKFPASRAKAIARVARTNPDLADRIRAYKLKADSPHAANDDQGDLFGSG
jgi:hypothetical protein